MTMTGRLWTSFASRVTRFTVDGDGATAIEYGLIAAGIAMVIIGVVYGVGSSIQSTLYDKIYQGLGGS